MRSFRHSIGFRLLVISFMLLALPLLIDSFLLIQKSYKQTLAEAKNLLIATSQLRELPLASIQPINTSVLAVLAHFLDLETHFPKEPTPELTATLQEMAKLGSFSTIFLLTITPEQHYIVTASNVPVAVGRDYTDFLQKPNLISTYTGTQRSMSFFSFDPITLQPFCIVTYTILSKETGKPVGLLAILDDLNMKVSPLLRPIHDPYLIQFAILLPSGIIIEASDETLIFQHLRPFSMESIPFLIGKKRDLWPIIPKTSLKATPLPNEPFIEFTFQGHKQIGYLHTISHTTLSFLAYAARKNIFLSPFFDILDIYTVFILILIFGSIVAYCLTKRLTKPMDQLYSTMEAIQKGHLQVRYQRDRWGFEINELGSIFNSMIDNVLSQQKYAESQRIHREQYAHELALGREVQSSLIPQTMPSYEGVDLASLYIPTIEVGGDFYDLFIKQRQQAPSQLVLMIADASGKGVQACFYSFIIRHLLHTYTQEYDDVGKAITLANHVFKLDTGDTGMFVTAFVAVYDGASRRLHYFSAGHNPPMIRKKGGTIIKLENHGMAMGVFEMEKEREASIELEQGDTLILYTDGITETFDTQSHLFGESRLEQLLQEKEGLGAQEWVDTIIKEVRHFAGAAPQHDDITLLVMRIV